MSVAGDSSMEDLLYEGASARRFCGLSLAGVSPDEATILRCRHDLERHQLGQALIVLCALTSRRTREGATVAPDVAISPLTPRRALDTNAAVAIFRKHEIGSIEVGMQADPVALSHDRTIVDAEFIREIGLQQIRVDGDLRYSV